MTNTRIGNNASLVNNIKNYDKPNDKSDLNNLKKQIEAEEKLRHEVQMKYMKLYAKKKKETEEEYLKRINDLVEQYEKKNRKNTWNQRQELAQEQAKFGKGLTHIWGNLKNQTMELTKQVGEIIGNVAGAAKKSTEEYLGAYSQYYTQVETRLLGSSKSFESTSKIISNALSGSALVSQTNVLKKLSEYVEKGISYNVEQRAFLGEISNKIATTFDAANGTLLQLIRIQQADSTAARLGVESSLNKFLNNMFQDTSYLSGISDNISSTILGANSQLSRDGSVAFEYVVQKWLGSLSSVGVNSDTLQSIAQGLNYLGTGDVTGLAGNTSLQNLLVMAANNAGLNYSSLLSGGLNATTANDLLRGLVDYTQTIARTNNQVVKSQYAQLFGMTVSDLTSILNLSTKDLESISANMLTYSGAIAETEKQLSTVSDRVLIGDKINNVFNNVFSSIGEGIANNAALYTTYKVADLVESFGGINIPFINALGTGVDLNASVDQLLKVGVMARGAITKTSTILNGLSNMGKLSLDNWGANSTTGRGRGLSTTLSEGNFARTTSQTRFIGNSSESDLYAGTVTSAKDEAMQSVQGTEETKDSSKSLENIDITVISIYNLLDSWNGTDGLRIESSALSQILAKIGG